MADENAGGTPAASPAELVVEGWRSSSHSYALVNQHQLLHLVADPRLRVSHVDVPFFRPHWSQVDGGFTPQAKAVLAGLNRPRNARADLIYRISWPLRIHAGDAEKVFVFGTTELHRFQEGTLCGPTGSSAGVDFNAVDIITPSRWSQSGFLRVGFQPNRVHVIPHGVDCTQFRPISATEKIKLRTSLKIPQDAFVFLNVSAMTWNKGIAPLLAGFAIYCRRNPRALLVLKGGDALYGNLMDAVLAEAVRLNPAVTDSAVMAALRYMPGNLSQSEMAALYRVSDAYVSPYRAEGFNLPVLEALACGIPALVTAGGATDDFCPEHLSLRIAATPSSGPQGQYLEPAIDSIVQRMEEISASAEFRANAADAGPQWIAERYSWSKVSTALVELLTSARR